MTEFFIVTLWCALLIQVLMYLDSKKTDERFFEERIKDRLVEEAKVRLMNDRNKALDHKTSFMKPKTQPNVAFPPRDNQ